jgi:S1-C subfamily serine protease
MSSLFTAAILASALFQPDAPPAPKGAIGLKLEVRDGKLLIAEAIKGAPGMKAGLKTGDVILKANDVKVKEFADVNDQMAVINEVTRHAPGQMVTLRIRRGDREQSVEVILGKYADLFPKEKEGRDDK